ncbi:uncharacterized protein [Lolium perenne]|uniref:uncharacterized protein isoform X2 n=1 Tax=Lolium perenne TaxID=4522 RepID=UPI003A99EADD
MGPATCESRRSETATGARWRRLPSGAARNGENLDRESPIHSPIPVRPLLPNPCLSSSPTVAARVEERKGTAVTRAAPAVADSPFPAREEKRSGRRGTSTREAPSGASRGDRIEALELASLETGRCGGARASTPSRSRSPTPSSPTSPSSRRSSPPCSGHVSPLSAQMRVEYWRRLRPRQGEPRSRSCTDRPLSPPTTCSTVEARTSGTGCPPRCSMKFQKGFGRIDLSSVITCKRACPKRRES